MSDLVGRRLRVHHLVGEPFGSAAEAVGWFGAVQSQDYPAAKWALGQRMRGAVDSDIDAAFDRGDILRTHVMRRRGTSSCHATSGGSRSSRHIG